MLEVGYGIADITPQIGEPLSGFIFRENKPSIAIDSPLAVRVLALRDHKAVNLLISYDLLGIGPHLRRRIVHDLQANLGALYTENRCVLLTTHTHSAPPGIRLAGEAAPSPAYWDSVCAQTIEAVLKALGDFKYATLHLATIRIPGTTYNRRALLSDGRVSMALEPDLPVLQRGPLNDELTILVWRSSVGENIAGMIHFACHGVATCTYAVSADIPGELCTRISDLLNVRCLFLQGAAGDVNPTVVAVDYPQLRIWLERAMEYARALPSRLEQFDCQDIQVASTEINLSYAPFPSREQVAANVAGLEKIVAHELDSKEAQQALLLLTDIMNLRPDERPDTDKAAYAAAIFADVDRKILAAINKGQNLPPCPMRVSVWRIGNLFLAFVSAELFARTDIRLRSRHPEFVVLPVSYMAPLVGYIPDREEMEMGGYEVDNAWRFYRHLAPFAEDSEAKVVETLDGLIEKLA